MNEAITFLLTDVEGSTRLWETRPDAMRRINERHDALVDKVVGESGTVFRDRAEGDSSFAAFDDASEAVAAAVALQRAIEAEPWPDDLTVRVRAALHTGRAESRDGQYYGPVVNRGVRLRALAHGGQVIISEAVASAIEALPPGIELRDLGTHRLKELSVPERVYQVCAPDLDDHFPPLRSLDVVRNNLTTATTAFVGRTEETQALVALLAEQRLVTVTGSGGVGKTRLAREVAAALVERFSDGVWFVDFTAARSEADVGRATADAVGVKDDPVRTPAEAVAEHLRTTATLLVLDNCEQVAEAVGALVAGVLAAAPGVRVLITSRQPIGVAGERVWRVPPLVGDTALALFVDRARAVAPEREFDDDDSAVARELCEQLDGIPLAIEMAAARLGEMPSLRALADALRDRLAVGAADVGHGGPSRQRTMRATIEWSHELLQPAERRLLRRLAAFIGGFTLDAAEGVCADERLDAFDVLDLLGQLVAQSLVQADEDGAEFRYRLLEVVREFAAERLAEGPEFLTVQSRHQAWFMHFAEREGSQLFFGEMAGALDALERELPNLRRAIEWSGEPLEEDVRYRLVAALHRLWARRGFADDGLRMADLVLETPVVRRGWRTAVMINAGALAEQQGRAELARGHYRSAAALLAEMDADIDTWGAALDAGARAAYLQNSAGQQAWCLVRQAILDSTGAERARLASEAVRLARLAGGHTLAIVLGSAGEVAYLDERFEDAAVMFSEALPIVESTGDRVEVAQTQLRLGATEWAQGRFGRAERLYRAAQASSDAAGDPNGAAEAARNLADLAVLLGDPAGRSMALDAWEQLDSLGMDKTATGALLLRVRAGEIDLAEEAVEAAQRLGERGLLVDAVIFATEVAPTHAALKEWIEVAEGALVGLPPWRASGVLASRALAERDAQLLVDAADALGDQPSPIGLIDVLRLAAAAHFDPAIQREAACLLDAVVEGLRACEDADTAAPLGQWRDDLKRLARASSPTRKE